MKKLESISSSGASQRNDFEELFAGYEQSITFAAQSVAKDFNHFFKGFDIEYSRARKQRVSTTPNLSVLRVFGLTTRELRHSDALAWFLREDGEHEQGDLFLRALLKIVEVNIPQQINYAIEREKYGRTDISAHAANNFAVFIENKIRDREEEPRQFERLVESLTKFSETKGIPEHARVAVFLTDDGRAPDTAPKSSKVIMRNMSRVELFGAFSDALQMTTAKSPLLDQLLANYIREIRWLV